MRFSYIHIHTYMYVHKYILLYMLYIYCIYLIRHSTADRNICCVTKDNFDLYIIYVYTHIQINKINTQMFRKLIITEINTEIMRKLP